MLNLLDIKPGQIVRMKDGTTAEVVDNVGDGLWLNARFASGDEELVFCEDIVGLQESTAQ